MSKSRGKRKKGNDDDNEEEDSPLAKKPVTPQAPSFDIDIGIPVPCQCMTPLTQADCLEQLATDTGVDRVIHTVVKSVNCLEVSYVEIM